MVLAAFDPAFGVVAILVTLWLAALCVSISKSVVFIHSPRTLRVHWRRWLLEMTCGLMVVAGVYAPFSAILDPSGGGFAQSFLARWWAYLATVALAALVGTALLLSYHGLTHMLRATIGGGDTGPIGAILARRCGHGCARLILRLRHAYHHLAGS